jgi:hypothetical protein
MAVAASLPVSGISGASMSWVGICAVGVDWVELAEHQHEAMMEDLAVRQATKRLGLTPVGSLGIVVKAYRAGHILCTNSPAAVPPDVRKVCDFPGS